MPLYEYYCEKCDNVFEALGSISASDAGAKCPKCGGASDRIMPTTFASRTRTGGWKQRVPFHHGNLRGDEPKPPIARVKPKAAGGRSKNQGAKKA